MCNDVKTTPIRRKTLADITIKDIDIVLATLLFFAPTDGSGGGAYSLVRYGLIAYLVLKNFLCCKSIPIATMLLSAFSALMAYSTWVNTHSMVPSRFFRKLIEAASAPPCSSPPPSCSARPSPPASTCPGTSSCPIRAPRCTSASPSPASGPSCRPGRSLRLSSSA